MAQETEIWKELEQYYVIQNGATMSACFDGDLAPLLELVSQKTNSEQPYVTASMVTRCAAFIFTARLFALCKFRVKWTGHLSRIGLADHVVNGSWFPQWVLSDGNWEKIQDEADILAEIQRILCLDCRQIVKSVSYETNSSQHVLWENIWGYVLWMYVQLLRQPSDIQSKASHDLNILLDSQTWSGVERSSPFKRFLRGKTPEEAMDQFSRVTCCYYYKIPGHQKCSYCPNLHKQGS
ncbi:hypothetical protein D0469_14335 [Peribacillus saganii]|uniref:Ferric siderophore reductase C-terminal domain-containing protein n=1 Tax=Peribacillus saganii TaxID=2303992 RepID=A0A372LMD0_9BACI|nr:(2Fe-2S)-binding protein [Peribacillus saganii]RFU67585.1 hypothetical protein D0469_14335 [Peribacillus saganii]